MGGDHCDEERTPILGTSSSDLQSNESLKRRGTKWSAVAHIITGVIGAGVLSLSWSVAQLGWIAGPLSMLLFAGITVVSTRILSDLYRYPDAEFGHIRCGSYSEAVRLYLGEKWHYASGIMAQENLYGCGIAYTITAAGSIRCIFAFYFSNQSPQIIPSIFITEWTKAIYVPLFA